MDPSGTWSALHVSNRQRVNGFTYPRRFADDVEFFLSLAVARFEESTEQLAQSIKVQFEAAMRTPPQPPTGVPADPRVVEITGALAEQFGAQASASKQLGEGLRRLAAQVQWKGGFATTPSTVVERAVGLTGFVPLMITADAGFDDGSAAGAAASEQVAERKKKGWIAVLSGDHEFVEAWLDESFDAVAILVCTDKKNLDELELPVVDALDEDDDPIEVGYTQTAPADLNKDFERQGVESFVATMRPDTSDDIDVVMNALACIRRLASGRSQGVVVTGDEGQVEKVHGRLRHFDSVALCASREALSRIGVAIADAAELSEAPEEDEDLFERPRDLPDSPGVSVAGKQVLDPVEVVLRFLSDHGGTVTHYDWLAGTSEEITPELVRATRSPWMGSRISASEEDWFIAHGRSAPWSDVQPDAQLVEADPRVSGGLYDAAERLWGHFSSEAPKGIGTAKIAKVLYLMRPGLFPILDSHLLTLYEAAAEEAARSLASVRAEFREHKRMYWGAIQADLVANKEALAALKLALSRSGNPLAEEASRRLSDLRLLDIAAWSLG